MQQIEHYWLTLVVFLMKIIVQQRGQTIDCSIIDISNFGLPTYFFMSIRVSSFILRTDGCLQRKQYRINDEVIIARSFPAQINTIRDPLKASCASHSDIMLITDDLELNHTN